MRIIFADDHNLIRETVGTLVRKVASNVDLVEASNFGEAVAKASSGSVPDLIILDLYMPGMNHLRGVEEMRSKFPRVPVVILTGSVDLDDAYAALERGASGYIPKTIGSQAMLNALRMVLAGEKFLPSMLVADSEKLELGTAAREDRSDGGESAKTSPLNKLTPREREVVQLLTAGHPNKEIARRLGLQEITVKVHLKGIYRKLGVVNRTQAVRSVIELGLDSSTRRKLGTGPAPAESSATSGA
jgi:DNA-binding NarL/FixJ family response regulator